MEQELAQKLIQSNEQTQAILVGMAENMQIMQKDITEIKGRQTSLEQKVDTIEQDVAVIKEKQTTMEKDITEIKVRQASLEYTVKGMDKKIDALDIKLDRNSEDAAKIIQLFIKREAAIEKYLGIKLPTE